MRFSIFPKRAFVFKSHCTRAEVVDALSSNVMMPADFTVNFWGKMADEHLGRRRYFEGQVNDYDFRINYKSYTVATPSTYGMSFIPQIWGEITEVSDGVTMRVVFTGPTPPVVLLILIIPSVVMSGVFGSWSLVKHFVAFLCVGLGGMLALRSLSYRYRIQKDMEQLRMICKAEEI